MTPVRGLTHGITTFTLIGFSLGIPLSPAQAAPGERVVDLFASRLVQKIHNESCQQLETSLQVSDKKQERVFKDAIEKEFFTVLKNNPSLKTRFFNQISAPLLTKMFDCGMFPPK